MGCIGILFAATALAQNGKTVLLKWKLPPAKNFTYNMVMQTIDTTKFTEYTLSPEELSNLFGSSTAFKLPETKQFFSSLSKTFQNIDFSLKLKENEHGYVDLEMVSKDKQDAAANKTDNTENVITEFPKMMKKLEGNIVLRGAVNHDGSIQSFYTKNEQRNLLAIFFELPKKEVSVGDTWPLAVNLISMDQHFTCETQHNND